MGAAPGRIVVADDSAFMRRLLSAALGEAGFDVVGVAADGAEALALCEATRPDALTLDLEMPGLNGLDVMRKLRTTPQAPPVVVVSGFSPAFGARAVDCLAEGAFELVAKPAAGESLTRFLEDLRSKVGAAVGTKLRAPVRAAAAAIARRRPAAGANARAVVLACSTGGPRALGELVPMLPAKVGRGTLIVQHMPAGFTASLAERLDRQSKLTVHEATGGETVDPGIAYLAPGGSHLRVDAGGKLRLGDDAAVGGLRPRADLTIGDAAVAFGEQTLLVVLTGMGKDGLDGARAVKAKGGRVFVEAESTCTVYGMPRAVVDAGLADEVLPLGELAEAIAVEAGA